MVITRTLDIDAAVARLKLEAVVLLSLADDFASPDGGEDGLRGLVAELNTAVQRAGDARDDIEAAVDEYLNEGDDEYTDDDEEEPGCAECGAALGEGHDDDCPHAPWNDEEINDDFPLYMEYDEGDDFRNTDNPHE
jgi:hypothetical protein